MAIRLGIEQFQYVPLYRPGGPGLLNSTLVGVGTILNRTLYLPLVLLFVRGAVLGSCRDCAQAPFGGPSDNRFTAYDSLCGAASCRTQGMPQVSVNLSNLTLF